MLEKADKPTEPMARDAGPESTASSPVPGQRWGKFLIEKHLGGGGQAEVFQAFDQIGTAGHVALKVAHRPLGQREAETWLDIEAGALVELDHPNIVRVADAGRVGDFPYVATELVEGLPLHEHVRLNPPSLREILDWMVQLAEAVHAAHSRGIVHRDLKPTNVIVTPDGRLLIVDFGVASMVTPYQPEPRRGRSGTPDYVAPEQARGDPEADHRVDIFGLGAILKLLLVEEGPYHGAENPLSAAMSGDVKPIAEASGPALRRALSRIANCALDPDPGKRYQSAREMAVTLRRLRSRGALMLALAAVVLLAIGVAALLAAAGRPEEQPVQARLEIHFQRKGQVGSHQVLTPDALPLRDGDRIQIHAELDRPLIPYVIAVSAQEAQLLYPAPGVDAGRVTEVQVPAGDDQWLPLVPPGGTETILLLAREEPLPDPESFVGELFALGPPPALDGDGLYVVDGSNCRLLEVGRDRPLGAKAVTVEKGFLTELAKQVPQEWQVVRAVAFRHEGGMP